MRAFMRLPPCAPARVNPLLSQRKRERPAPAEKRGPGVLVSRGGGRARSAGDNAPSQRKSVVNVSGDGGHVLPARTGMSRWAFAETCRRAHEPDLRARP